MEEDRTNGGGQNSSSSVKNIINMNNNARTKRVIEQAYPGYLYSIGPRRLSGKIISRK